LRTGAIQLTDLQGVFPVPPLARRQDAARSLDFEQNERIVRHIEAGGLSRILYGGNAMLYHITLAEYAQLLEWLAALETDSWLIPSAGPSFGRAMDQAPLLRRYPFPTVMMLPCSDPRDAEGLYQGLREFADAAEKRLILYLKDETNFGADRRKGLKAIGRLAQEGVCVSIKYAVVRRDPADDPFLDALLEHVDCRCVVSGIGERPAVVHMRQFGLPGFTTGSGCVAPGLCRRLFAACQLGAWDEAERLRAAFLPLEDIRDAVGPTPVLHAAVERAGIARTGPLPPFASAISEERLRDLDAVVGELGAIEARDH
jgi:dihydrodipicolinate synthase/N-acetylneuraminate lyase